jgi:hypothetical protein
MSTAIDKKYAVDSTYSVDITLKCDLITANNLEHLDSIINRYIDQLAKQADDSITWCEVDWKIEEIR